MKIRIKYGQADGKELVAKNLQSARLRDVREFQRESGMKLEEVKEEVELSDGAALGTAIVAYLSLHNAGFTPKWEDILDQPQEAFEMVEDELDRIKREEAEAEQKAAADTPQPARTDSRPGDSGPAPKRARSAATRA